MLNHELIQFFKCALVFRSPVLEQMHSLTDTSEFLSQKQTLESAHTCFNHKSFSENIQQSNFKLFEHLSFHFCSESGQILPTLLGFSLICTVHLFKLIFWKTWGYFALYMFETHPQSSAATSSIHNLVYVQIGANAPSKYLVNPLKMVKPSGKKQWEITQQVALYLKLPSWLADYDTCFHKCCFISNGILFNQKESKASEPIKQKMNDPTLNITTQNYDHSLFCYNILSSLSQVA